MEAGVTSPTMMAAKLEELHRENVELKEHLRRLGAQTVVAQGAITEAVHEKEATARIAHQVGVEERATRAAVEVQSSNLGLSVILQILNFFMLLVLLFGLFVWLPGAVEERVRPATTITMPGGGTVVR